MRTFITLLSLGIFSLVSADQYNGNYACRNCQECYPNSRQYQDRQYQDRQYPDQQTYYQRGDGYQENVQYGRDDRGYLSDQEIIKRIRNALDSGWFSRGFEAVTFSVNNGSVNLKGTVDSLADKNRIEENIKKIEGVREINNQIMVAKPDVMYSDAQLMNLENKHPQDIAATSQDRQINARIRAKLSDTWFSKFDNNVTVKTTNGTVVLTGTVDRLEDIQKISDSLQRIEGVRSVKNQLTVK